MALIQSGASSDLLTVDSASKAARVTLYDAAGKPISALPVQLVSGDLASMTVALEDGSTVALTPGTTVALANGARVGLEAGTTVNVSGTVQVEAGEDPVVVALDGTPTVRVDSTSLSLSAITSSVRVEPGTGTLPVSVQNTPTVNVNSHGVTTSAADSSVRVEAGTTNLPVAIQGTPAVTLSGAPAVSITGTPAVTTSSTSSSVKVEPGTNPLTVATHAVTVSGTPAVTTSSASSSVKVEAGTSNLPVAVQGTPNVAVTNTPAVTISGTPGVTTSSATSSVKVEPGATALNVATHPVTISGTPAVTVSGTAAADVTDRSARLLGHVTVDNLPATQPVSGTVAVSNLPATQPVSGTVSVGNFPATQPVSGSVTVSNFPATQTADVSDRTARALGHVTVDNFPASQTVTGSVSVSNFPATQAVDVTDRAVRSLGQVRLGTAAQIAASSTVGGPFEAAAYPGANSLKVTTEPSSLLVDAFDGATVDANRWTVTGTGITVGGGMLKVATGTTAGAYSTIASNASFVAMADAFIRVGWLVQQPSTNITNAYRFIGLATVPATPTATAPITDGVGFETLTDGTSYCVVWANGARVFQQAIPTLNDGAWHRFSLLVRSSVTQWFIDDITVPIARASMISPTVQNLPLRGLVVNGTTAPAASATFTFGMVTVGDTGSNSFQLADATYPTRKATITSSGQVYVTDSVRNAPAVVAGSTGVYTVAASAATAAAGFLYIFNPTTSTKLMAIRRIEVHSQLVGGVAAPANTPATRMIAARFTATGTLTAASLGPAAIDTTVPVTTGQATAASTGLTVTAGATVYSWLLAGVYLQASTLPTSIAATDVPVVNSWDPKEDGQVVLRPGQGIVMYQADAGLSGDPRRVMVNYAWEEWTP